MVLSKQKKEVDIKIEKINEFKGMDLEDLCDATETTITEDSLSFSIGLNRTDPMVRERLEAYWRGVVLVPERQLIIGKIDDVTAAAVLPPTANFCSKTDKLCSKLAFL